uniref:Uncharacterized protein n=1 Tax=Physcomitrium patens TaxID=3218 RepID=A0A2K1J901_PHYPA|nr:hypothetical protein PHYPA_021119 [Physcomitrium patens]
MDRSQLSGVTASDSWLFETSSSPRYEVGNRNNVDKEKLVAGTRVALNMATLTIIRALPIERWVLQSGESTSLQHFPRSPWERVFEGGLKCNYGQVHWRKGKVDSEDVWPCIVFMDEKDVIGRRFSDGTSADWEIQRMSMELSNQPNGFDQLGKGPLVIKRLVDFWWALPHEALEVRFCNGSVTFCRFLPASTQARGNQSQTNDTLVRRKAR